MFRRKSAIYGAARICILQKQLISRSDMRRLAEANSESEALCFLSELGYGGKCCGTSADVELLINKELLDCRNVVVELSSDKTLTDAILMRADMNNLSLLLKLQAQGLDFSAARLDNTGVIGLNVIKEMVKSGEYSCLPKQIASAAAIFKSKKANAAEISAGIDKAYYMYLMSLESKLMKEYFGAERDFYNIIALMRMKNLHFNTNSARAVLIPQGEIPHERLMAAFNTEDFSLVAAGCRAELNAAVKIGLANVSLMERERDKYLLRLIERGKDDMETVLPVVFYYLMRKREARHIRTIITLKRNGFASKAIKERVGCDYV